MHGASQQEHYDDAPGKGELDVAFDEYTLNKEWKPEYKETVYYQLDGPKLIKTLYKLQKRKDEKSSKLWLLMSTLKDPLYNAQHLPNAYKMQMATAKSNTKYANHDQRWRRLLKSQQQYKDEEEG